jgi:tRNA(Ile)-lysidine synthase TilS/MesJ
MWLKMKKNYPGIGKPIKGLEGISVQEGREYDLPDTVAKLLIKTGFAEKTVAPWAKKLNPLAPKIQAYKTDFAKLEEALTKKRAALKHAQEIAATIPNCQEDIKELEEQRNNLQIEIVDFANKNKIPFVEIADGIQVEAGPEGQTAAENAADTAR